MRIAFIVSTFPKLSETFISLVPERDRIGLAERIQYLIERPHTWEAMGRAGREFVEKKYDIKKLNRELVNIYEGLLRK